MVREVFVTVIIEDTPAKTVIDVTQPSAIAVVGLAHGRLHGSPVLRVQRRRRKHPRLLAQLGQQPFLHVIDTGVHPCCGRNAIVMMGSAYRHPIVSVAQVGLGVVVILYECIQPKRRPIHLQWLKDLLGHVAGVVHIGQFLDDIADQAEYDILITVALSWSADKIDLVQSFNDALVRHIVFDQIGVGVWHEAARLGHQVVQGNPVAIVRPFEVKVLQL